MLQNAMKKNMNKNLVGLLASGVLVIAAPLIGLTFTVFFLRGAFQATAGADPSQKSRLLAEGISEAMNGTAFGLVVSCIALVPTVVFAVRLHRDSKRGPPPPAD
jgi:biopolymer transport protein ExbB/TolQ